MGHNVSDKQPRAASPNAAPPNLAAAWQDSYEPFNLTSGRNTRPSARETNAARSFAASVLLDLRTRSAREASGLEAHCLHGAVWVRMGPPKNRATRRRELGITLPGGGDLPIGR